MVMRAPRMQKLYVIFLACEAVNGGVNGTSALSSAYLICSVRGRKSFGLSWSRLPVWDPIAPATGEAEIRLASPVAASGVRSEAQLWR